MGADQSKAAKAQENTECHLLELPGELRNNIYEYVSSSNIVIDLETQEDHAAYLAQQQRDRKSLLATCKQIHQEYASYAAEPRVVKIKLPIFGGGPSADNYRSMLTELEDLVANALLPPGPLNIYMGQLTCGPEATISRQHAFENIYGFWYDLIVTRWQGLSRSNNRNTKLSFDLKARHGSIVTFNFNPDKETAKQDLKCGSMADGTQAELADEEAKALDQFFEPFWMVMGIWG